jgi:hypothetical protein
MHGPYNVKKRPVMYVQRSTEERSCNHCCIGKAIKYYIFSVRACSLRYPLRSAHGPYCHLWPVRLYKIFFFPHCLINGTIFEGKKVIERKMCVLISSTILTETFFILRTTEQDMIINVYRYIYVKYP